jgi:hypothetical protein
LSPVLRQALGALRKADGEKIFHAPVDTHVVDDYLTIVTEPMGTWLGRA